MSRTVTVANRLIKAGIKINAICGWSEEFDAELTLINGYTLQIGYDYTCLNWCNNATDDSWVMVELKMNPTPAYIKKQITNLDPRSKA